MLQQFVAQTREAKEKRQREATGDNKRPREATPCNQRWGTEEGSHKGKLVKEIKKGKAMGGKGTPRETTGGNGRQHRAAEYGKPKKEATKGN